jgi:hypothetical protein
VSDPWPRQPLRCERLQSGPFFTVINRTCRPLSVVVDGVTMVMQPGPNLNVPAAFAEFSEKQHPRLGTYDDTIKGGETLLVVKELCDDPARMAMIRPGREHLGPELTDRTAFPQPAERGEVVLERMSRPRTYEDETGFHSAKTHFSMFGNPDSD